MSLCQSIFLLERKVCVSEDEGVVLEEVKIREYLNAKYLCGEIVSL